MWKQGQEWVWKKALGEKRDRKSPPPHPNPDRGQVHSSRGNKEGLADPEQVGAQFSHILGTAEGFPERTRRIPRCWVNEDNVKSRSRVLGKPAQPEGEMSLSYHHPAPHPDALCVRDFQYLPTSVVALVVRVAYRILATSCLY